MNVYEIICEIKNILEGCHSIIDAHYFRLYYIKIYPQYEKLINSLIDGYSYFDNFDIISKEEIIKDIINCDDRDKAFNIIEKHVTRSNDNFFINCSNKIADRKGIKHDDKKIITKCCPHCNHKISAPKDTVYVICGYHDSNLGYDQKGCGKDFCFSCGKKLCKSWFENNLHNELNRYHDDTCCKMKAIDNDEEYSNYCDCGAINRNVHTTYL